MPYPDYFGKNTNLLFMNIIILTFSRGCDEEEINEIYLIMLVSIVVMPAESELAASFAAKAFLRCMENCKISLEKLFVLIRPRLCRYFAEQFVFQFKMSKDQGRKMTPEDGTDYILATFERLAVLFGKEKDGKPSTYDVMNECSDYFIPVLMLESVENNESTSLVHHCFVNAMQTNRNFLVSNKFPLILIAIYMETNSPATIDRILDFVVSEGQRGADKKLKLQEFLSLNSFACLYEALLQISRDPGRALHLIANHLRPESTEIPNSKTKFGGESEVAPKDSRKEAIKQIKPRFQGVMVNFEERFRAEISLDELRVTMNSFIYVISFVGSDVIEDNVLKVISTLRVSMESEEEEIRRLSCKAWDAFSRSLPILAFKEILFQVLAICLPLISGFQNEMRPLLSYIFNEKISEFGTKLEEIAWFLSAGSDANFHQNYLQKYCQKFFTLMADESLDRCIEFLAIGNDQTKELVLIKLRTVLEKSQARLFKIFNGSENVEPIGERLILVLLQALSFRSNVQVQCLAAECLGWIGAVDPGRLHLRPVPGSKQMAFIQLDTRDDAQFGNNSQYGNNSRLDTQFPVALLKQLIKSYTNASEGSLHNACSLAIQETFRFFKVKSSPADNIWNKLSENSQKIVEPLLSTQFVCRTALPDANLLPSPLYSEYFPNFAKWISVWCRSLIAQVKIFFLIWCQSLIAQVGIGFFLIFNLVLHFSCTKVRRKEDYCNIAASLQNLRTFIWRNFCCLKQFCR